MVSDNLAQLHIESYNAVAPEYEARVNTLRPVTEYALSRLTRYLEPGAQVLDIGCGVGYTTEILRESGMQAEGIDIAPRMIDFAAQRNPPNAVRTEDFLAAEYPQDSYDAALLYAFLHLFPTPTAEACLAKVSHILKAGGYALIGTTKSDISSEGFETKADYETTAQRYRKRWTPAELETAVARNGLTVVHHEDIVDEFGKTWMDYVVKLG